MEIIIGDAFFEAFKMAFFLFLFVAGILVALGIYLGNAPWFLKKTGGAPSKPRERKKLYAVLAVGFVLVYTIMLPVAAFTVTSYNTITIQPDGTWVLKNAWRIPVGKINPDEKRRVSPKSSRSPLPDSTIWTRPSHSSDYAVFIETDTSVYYSVASRDSERRRTRYHIIAKAKIISEKIPPNLSLEESVEPFDWREKILAWQVYIIIAICLPTAVWMWVDRFQFRKRK